jgi:hypothetical protein
MKIDEIDENLDENGCVWAASERLFHLRFHLSGPYYSSGKIKLRDRDAVLVVVKDGQVLHHTPNMSLPHVAFVRRATGSLPEAAWVGTEPRHLGCHEFFEPRTTRKTPTNQ